jgi:hypothetical protein
LHRKFVLGLKFILSKQHDLDVFADNHAGRDLVSELRVECETELTEEIHGSPKILYGQIDEDLLGHVLSFEIVRTPTPTITSTIKGQIDTTTIIFGRVGQGIK